MRDKKNTGEIKKPKETGTWYRSLIEGKTKTEFYKAFIKKVNKLITENFGEAEATRVLQAIDQKKIEIIGIENFLFDFNDISDSSLNFCDTSKCLEEFITKSILSFKKKREMGEKNIFIKEFFLALSDILVTFDMHSKVVIEGDFVILCNLFCESSLSSTWRT